MTNYWLRRAIMFGIITTTLLAACSCAKTDKRTSPVNTKNSARSPDESSLEHGEYVIGKEMAKAVEAEKRWQQQGTQKSPLPKRDYDFWRGDQYFVDPAPNTLDDELREVARRYADSDPQRRTAIRSSISMDGFYTLMTFFRRAAVFAVRERKAEIVRDGLIAVAMINQERVDFRDILMCLSLLYHAAGRAGAHPDEIFRQTAMLAEPEVGKLIAGFVDQTPKSRSIRSSWGYDEVQTERGFGFIGWDFQKYDPTIDLKVVVLEVAKLVAADKYQPDSVTVASELPSIWLSRSKNIELDRVLARIRAGATMSARLRPNEHLKHDCQQFNVFIVETSQDSEAQILLRLSRAGDTRGHSMIRVAAGKLFSLVVARAWADGVDAYETPNSLARFEEGLNKILARYAGKTR
jgi:hypothetical protein